MGEKERLLALTRRPNREATAVVPKPSHTQVNYLDPHYELTVAVGRVGMLGLGKPASRPPSAPSRSRTPQPSANYKMRLPEAQTEHM